MIDMGSFNETCALSNLDITPGTKVRLLFLTQNPYVRADQREQRRGARHHDQWFVRTPPIKGEYDDYGRCKFTRTKIVELVEACFDKDAVERPYGFNKYHAGPVTRGAGIDQYLAAAWEGRLLVRDDCTQPDDAPAHWPTWRRLHAILKESGRELQVDNSGTGKDGGYNAQDVAPGVCCVTYNSYTDEVKKLNAVKKVFADRYDCKLTYRVPTAKYEPVLMVVPKSGFADPILLFDSARAKRAADTHPSNHQKYRDLPCLAVMIREDVWKVYANTKISEPSRAGGKSITVKNTIEKLKERCAPRPSKVFFKIDEMRFRDTLFTIPFQTTCATHLVAALEDKEYGPLDDLIRAAAELSRVEYVMATLHHSWYVPCLGGQEANWGLRTKVLSAVAQLSAEEFAREK